MFETGAFDSWPLVILGATCFAVLFAGVGMMTEFFFDGQFHVTKHVFGLSLFAFAGYILVAYQLRQESRST